jgi:hypothetical protein
MNDEDLRDLFAGLYMQGYTARNASSYANTAREAYLMADAMIEAKYAESVSEPEEGITAIKPKRKRSVNVSSTNS